MASKASNGLVYILLALLILGLGGFGATSFTGSVSSVAKVDGKPVRIDSYSRELQTQMNQLGQQQLGRPLTLAEAQGFGIPQGVLAQLISDRSLDAEAARLGLSVGDDTLGQQIMQIQAFQGPNGTFSRDTYSFALQQAGLSEKEFEGDLRDETARSVLQAAVIAATRMPATYADVLTRYIAETRDVTLLRLDQDDLPEALAEPSEEELRAFYEENIADYTAPEKKRITYAMLSPDALIDTVPVDAERIREVYESRIDEFEQPERRLVERLAFSDEAAAEAAKAALDAGETDFETLVADRGLTLTDVDRGDVSQAALGAAGEAVFAAESGDVVGPLPSDLGPALFRVNGVLAANNVDYGTASLMIREELAADAARREVSLQAEPAEDLLAGGATLEELAEETGMELGSIDWYDGLSEGIAGYADFDEAAAAVAQGDYPEIAELDDGGIFALRLDEVIAPAPEAFEDVRDRVQNNWEAQQTDAALTARAEEILSRLDAGETLEAVAEAEGLELTTETGITRGGNVLGTATGYNASVFEMEEGAAMISSAFGAVILTRLDAVTPPAEEDEQTALLRQQITSQVSSGLAQDLYSAYADEVQGSMDVRVDQEALNAIHSQFQ
ncbi:SurA N-terminal domain-containing protein [Oceanicola sp. S124]|uniref:SurA N-terminal domain-containing protein n=1 Tax=Oceanicola sp. S124 TaxID=1042378 RepID=UPI0002558543|nr:SurA N-terminal domain-containing protein [Oceanicola sp. S124]